MRPPDPSPFRGRPSSDEGLRGPNLRSGEALEELTLVPDAEAASAVQVRGGLEPVPLDRPEDVCTLLATTINEVRAGAVPPAVANSIGYLAGQWTKSFETAELARKIAGLELIVQRA